MSQLLRSAALVLASSAALTGCFGPNDPYPPGASSSSSSSSSPNSNSSYNYNYNSAPAAAPQAPATAPAMTDDSCVALEVPSKGQLSADVVGTWQDWTGGSLKLTTFNADGTVTISAYPADKDGLPDEKLAPVVELNGTWTAAENLLTIRWENGSKEANVALVDSTPGCTMLELTIPQEGTSALPNPSQLERVTCPTPVVPVGGIVR